MSQRAMLAWLNDLLETQMKSINELGAGWQYCQLIDMVFAKAIPLSRVIFTARNEEQRLTNYKLLMNFLAKHQVSYPSEAVDVQKLVKGHQTHNLAFLTWFKRWHEEMTESDPLPPYPAAQRRQMFSAAPAKATPSRALPPATPAGARRQRKRKLPSPEDVARALPLDDETGNTTTTTAAATPTPPPAIEPRLSGVAEMGPAMQFLMKHKANIRGAKRQRVATRASVTERPLGEPTATTPALAAASPAPHIASVDNAAAARLREENRRLLEESKRHASEKQFLQKQMRELEAKVGRCQDDVREAEERMKQAERQERLCREEKREKESELRELKEKVGALQRDVEMATSQLREKDANLERAASVRRMLHNSLQELKGNIRVFARLRPALSGEEYPESVFGFPDSLDQRRVEITEPAGTSVTGALKSGRATTFEFDKVFTPDSSQESVFEEVSNLVQSCLDGYKVCIFAYGQTGSGKTHTMEGAQGDEGLIPRAVNLLFERSKDMRERGWTMTLKARYVEIYNDKLRDLLGSGEKEEKIDIHHSRHGTEDDTHLTNCTVVDVVDCDAVHRVLNQAKSRRTTAATRMNERSSRSHSVFTLKIYGQNTGTGQRMLSEINLIDLAGSERVKDSGVTGDALREAEHINTSLTHLGNVIQQLHSIGRPLGKGDNKGKMNHIFRNSTLTWLLKTCLGGDCKTLMLVNISPVLASLQETTNSLRFATKVNNCQIGTASKRVK